MIGKITNQFYNKSKMLFHYSIVETSMGWIGIAGSKNALRMMVLPEKTKEDAFKQLIKKAHSENQLILADEEFLCITEKIRDYFDGKFIQFDNQEINLSRYTPFQQAILLKTREIPYGETRTYKWLAEESGYPRAYRAAGGVMRINPIPLIIPCHRVLGNQGKLTGFSATGGLALKCRMLSLEGIRHDK